MSGRSGDSGNESNNGCFAETCTINVKTDDGHVITKQLRDVTVSDLVESVDRKTGQSVFSEVVFMDHDDDPNPWEKVLKFSYQDEEGKEEVMLTVTPNHLIYVSKTPDSHPLKGPVQARNIQVGDYLWARSSNGDGFEPRQVTSISEDKAKIINPITNNHHIVVQGVHASTHVDNEKHYRLSANAFRALYALNPKLCTSKPLKKFNAMITYKKAEAPVPPSPVEF